MIIDKNIKIGSIDQTIDNYFIILDLLVTKDKDISVDFLI